jgi:RND family efflux transporter MFP subunit
MLLWVICPCATSAGDDDPLGPFDVVIAVVDEVDVPAQVPGLITELPAKIGHQVPSGTLLARVDDAAVRLERERIATELAIAVHRHENGLAVQLAEKALGVAQAEFMRAKNANVAHPNTVSQTEVERLQFVRDRAELEQAQAQHSLREAELAVDQKQHELALADLSVRRREICAPVSGQVIEVLHSVGEWVEPGETVVRLLNTERVRAEAMVDLSVVNQDVSGRRVRVVLAIPGQPERRFEGHVEFVDPQINVVNGEFRICAEIENPDRLLRPGHRASMTILPVASADLGASRPSAP